MPILQGNAKSVADGFYPLEINQSLRFNDNDSAYLSRTPTTAGNQKTWTFSCWFKAGNLGINRVLLACRVAGTDRTVMRLNSDNTLFIIDDDISWQLVTTQVFRDTSAWYHLVLSVDTTQATASNRVKVYINGSQVTSFSTATYPSLNYDTRINSTATQYIGFDSLGDYFDGYMGEVHLTDGTAYNASAFGEFKSGVWVAKTPSVTYGTNGFYLPFDSVYPLALDSTGKYSGINLGASTVYDATYGSNVAYLNNDTTYDGLGQAIRSQNVPATSNMSFSWWYNGSYQTDNNPTQFSLTSGYTGSYAQALSVGFNGTAMNYDYIPNQGTSSGRISSSVAAASASNTWVHFVVIASGTSLIVYIDGSYVTTVNSLYDISTYLSSAYFGIGYRPRSDTAIYNATNGKFADFRIYSKDLNSTEITALYNRSGEPTDSLLAHYALDATETGVVDASANSNNWTANNLAATDVMLDSPTNNFATLNPINKSTACQLYQGNLFVGTTGGADASQSARGTIGISSGKHYFEFICWNTFSSGQAGECGIVAHDDAKLARDSQCPNAYSFGWGFGGSNFYQVVSASYTNLPLFASATSYTTVMSIAVDLDNGYMWIGRDGVWYNSGNPAAGANPTISGIDTTKTYLPFATAYSSTNYIYPFANFGQDSSFAGTKTPQGYTDANGIGDFYYAPPTGYLALCTANLPEPAISPLNGVSPTDYMNTVLYTGDGTSSHAITGVGFQPDLVWIKPRNAAYNHRLYDTVRGATKVLSSNVTNAEATNTSALTAFDSDGFTVGTAANENESGKTFVAWNWLANNTPVSNTDGTITSSVSANTTSGFSIVTWTDTVSSTSTVGHGLSSPPELIITKRRSSGASNWYTWTTAIDGTYDFFNGLNATDAAVADPAGRALPTSTVFTTVGGLVENQVAYCFHSVEGFSKIGSYVGNGSTNGVFVHCGFAPSFVLFKRSDSTGSWIMLDKERDTYNVVDHQLLPNSSAAEATNDYLDFLSNGFKLRSTWSDSNASGGTYIYIAFAENPFKYTTAR